MKKLFAVFLLMWGAVNSFGQVTEKDGVTTIRINCGPRQIDPAKSPMVIVNNKYIMLSLEDFKSRINIDDVEQLSIPKDDVNSLIQLYGEKGKNGIIKLDLFNRIKIYQIDELFDSFRVKDKYRSLPIYLNDKLITDRANFFITSTVIKTLKIVKKPTAEVADLEFIAIKTKL